MFGKDEQKRPRREKEEDRKEEGKKNGETETEELISLNNDGVRAVVTRARRYTVDSLYLPDRNDRKSPSVKLSKSEATESKMLVQFLCDEDECYKILDNRA